MIDTGGDKMHNPLKIVASIIALGICVAQPVAAQNSSANFPTKPIRILLSFPPGGSSDQITRLVAPIMAERLGQPVVVENRPGAGGAIAIGAVAKAEPDGHTIGVGAAGGLGVNAVLGSPQPYDAIKDLAPIGNMAMAAFVLVAAPGFKPATVNDIVAEAKRKPGSIAIGHGGPGTMMHLSTELFKQMAKIDATAVPYKGTAPATLDAMAGQIPLAMSDVPSSISYIKTGRLKAIAVTSVKRDHALPDVPTMAELGLSGYDSTGWIAMVAPAGTPAAIVKRLNAELVAALSRPDIREKVRASGYEVAAGTPDELQQMMKAEIAKWGALVKESKLKID
jgi:tripartite-type tricarboxylate transporter receptor subunit TctC